MYYKLHKVLNRTTVRNDTEKLKPRGKTYAPLQTYREKSRGGGGAPPPPSYKYINRAD